MTTEQLHQRKADILAELDVVDTTSYEGWTAEEIDRNITRGNALLEEADRIDEELYPNPTIRRVDYGH